MTDPPECLATRELIPELAAGVAAGDERARALGHLADCADCRRELARTAEVVDELLLLAPEREPPAGFESAVLAALAAERRPHRDGEPAGLALLPPRPEPAGRRHRWRQPVRWAASVAVVAALVAGGMWWGTADDRRLAADYRHTLETAHGTELRAASLTLADGTESGVAFAYQGNPSWVYVTFRWVPPNGSYLVQLRTTDHRLLTLRPFTVRDAERAWGSTLTVAIRDIVAIDFIRAGMPVMCARFTEG